MVRVPALNLTFLGRHTGNRLFLTLVGDDPRLRLKAGVETPAEAVLLELGPLARAHNGLPG